MPSSPPPKKVTIVIPNWNTKRWLPGCLDGLRAQTFRDFQIVLVDNGSTDGSPAFIADHYPEVCVVSLPENRGFAPAVNIGIRQAQSDYIVLLNVDTVPQPDWLENLVAAIEASPPDVGGLASKMLIMDNPALIDDAGNRLSWYGSATKRGHGQPAESYDELTEVFSISGGASLYRKSFLDEAGGFDDDFIIYLEDVDLGLRGRLLGYRFLFVPTAVIHHHWQGGGIPRPKYVTLMTRNRLAILLKNIPWPLLFKHGMTLLYGQVYYLLVYKKPGASLKGVAMFLTALPSILRQRAAIQRRRKISLGALDELLTRELGEPSLGEIFWRKFGGSS